MRILLIHNHYGSSAPSGENRVFEMEQAMLRRNGHEVKTLERYSDALRKRGTVGSIVGGLATPWNFQSARDVKGIINKFQPQVTHVHNTFPLLSAAVFPAARGSARILTLHNYRLQCAAGIPMRDGSPCTDCIEANSVLPALKYGCYRRSRLATVPIAANIALQRFSQLWHREIESFIALTDFQKRLMASGGLPFDRIEVKPNFYPGNPSRTPFVERPKHVIFIGRLSEEKGIEDLIQAWRIWGEEAPMLRIVGDGPERSRLERECKDHSNIVFLGQLPSDAAEVEVSKSRLMVVPSRWFEGFPMVLREAFAFGVGTAVSEIGPLPDIVANAKGATFRAGNPDDMAKCLRALWQDQERLEVMSNFAQQTFESRYTEGRNYDQLMEIYDRAISRM